MWALYGGEVEPMNQENISISDQVNNFNTFSVEIRNRIENLIKQVLVVSGGIQALTIGAFLSGKSPTLPEQAIGTLQLSWLLLSLSVICCLSLMFFQIIGLVHVGFKHRGKLETQTPGVEVMTAWLPLRILNWILGLSAFLCCISGVFLMGKAAIQIIA
jgi:hypothetical protein